MRILLLPSYFYPESYSSAHLDNDLYEHFASQGIQMVAFVPMPSRGIDKATRKQYLHQRKTALYNGFFDLHRFRLFPEGKGAITRAFRYTIAIVVQFFKGLFVRNIDAIYLVSTPPIIGIVGALLHKIKRIPFVYVVQDIFPDSLVHTGLSHKGSLAWKIGRKIEDYTYRNAERIIVISQDFLRNLLNKNVPEKKVEVIYNWIDTKSITPIKREENPLVDKWNLDSSHFYVVYAGNFGNAQNVDVVIHAAQLLQDDENIQFILIGGGSQEEYLKQFVEDNSIQNVNFFPLQTFEMLPFVYSLGDIGIVCCKQGMGKNAFPSKTWSYLAAGTPIVASYDLDSELAELISSTGIGIAIEPENAKEMADTILFLKNNKQKQLEEMSAAAKSVVETHASKKRAMEHYLHVVESVISRN